MVVKPKDGKHHDGKHLEIMVTWLTMVSIIADYKDLKSLNAFPKLVYL
jgi:hypothetical protein